MSNPFITPTTGFSRAYDYFYCHHCDAVLRVPVNTCKQEEIECPICKATMHIGTKNRKQMYVNLFKEGKTPEEIATATGVTERTVRNNIIKYYMECNDDEIKIENLITQPESVADITKLISQRHYMPSLSEIRNDLQMHYKTDCNYDTIAAVRAIYAKSHQIKIDM